MRMHAFTKLSDSEMAIMQAIWALETPVTVARLLSIFTDKHWKVQTMGTFLTRLVDKRLLTVAKHKNTNQYTAAITEAQYHQWEAQHLLHSMYDGSLRNFLSALYGGGGPATPDDAEALRTWFEQAAPHD
jgi:predicted transcriptional regulator